MRIPSCYLRLAVIGFTVLSSVLFTTMNGAAEEKAENGWRPLFDGKSLTGWKSANFGGEGEVRAADGQIELDAGNTLTGVTWQKEFPKTNYEIRLEAMQVDGNDFFCGLTFPVADSHCSFIVAGWGGSVVGLSNIDGMDASDNQTTRYQSFKQKQWYKIRVRVAPTLIEAWIDDKQVVKQDITGRKITIRPEVELSRPLGISAWQTKAFLRKIEYRELPAKKP
ncbi:3-keto-disaccharide hydrolase [Lignipirellula cremea]|uniref:3-keto-alpha-glucoside-1,2-lyase/3-keto-2-hydroxy-glucal hydratase domain-containing protein n=1 Tax=Lignipirellula cremea TaxID=2528010 RepID=A0A518E048_9BACT|nr:DUF1080 domain-containing protein [Lignipirellula cremea]QDU97441.1 hypothetical protein Pla8534_52890 [Lignipirellula cremea]